MKTKFMSVKCPFFLFFFLIPFLSQAQEISISLGPEEIALNEAFTITVTVKNGKLRTYNPNAFPEIPGFVKRGLSSSNSQRFVNGNISSEESIIQAYAPQQEGTFQLAPFKMSINGESIASEGQTITVGPPHQQRRSQQGFNPFGPSPFDDAFAEENEQQEEFVEVKDDAFLGLSLDKEEVYVGEGFTATLAFYVSNDNMATLSFHELGSQLGKIIKKLKPENTWEENFEIVNVKREDTRLNGKGYSKYTLYQARYYPLNAEPIHFPSVGLKMIKYKVAKRPSFFGRRQQEDFKTYYTKAKTVQVKPLPPHPMREQVAVGDYQLREKISEKQLQTGNSFSYSFSIVGQGNISAIPAPEPKTSPGLTFYEPNVSQNTRKEEGTVIGVKQFNYYGIPNEPGSYALADYFQWIYFNPRLSNYDTLQSRISIEVVGASRKDENILAKDPGAFYTRIENESNVLQSLQGDDQLTLFVNIFILLMLAATAIIIFKK